MFYLFSRKVISIVKLCCIFDTKKSFWKKSQKAFDYGSDKYNGRDGYLETSKPDLNKVHFGDLAEAFINAGIQTGSPRNEDFNGENQEGMGIYPTTTNAGLRSSTSRFEIFFKSIKANQEQKFRHAFFIVWFIYFLFWKSLPKIYSVILKFPKKLTLDES